MKSSASELGLRNTYWVKTDVGNFALKRFWGRLVVIGRFLPVVE